MPRLINGKINVSSGPQQIQNRLFTAGVIRSRSGPEGWNVIQDVDKLTALYDGCENFESYKKLVEGGVDLILSKQSNPEGYPDYSIRLTSNDSLPVVYPRSDIDYDALPQLNTEEGLADKLIYENYTCAYILKLDDVLVKGDYIVLPLLANWVKGYNLIIYTEGTIEDLEKYRDIFKIDPDVVTTRSEQLLAIGEHLASLTVPYYVDYSEIDNGILKFEYIDAYIFREDTKLTNGVLTRDFDRNLDLMVATTRDEVYIDFTSKIYGPRYKDIELSLRKLPFSNDYILKVGIDDYIESWRVEFNGGSDHFIEDVLVDSILIGATKDSTPSEDLSGIYGYIRTQNPLPYDIGSELAYSPFHLVSPYLSEGLVSDIVGALASMWISDLSITLDLVKQKLPQYVDAIDYELSTYSLRKMWESLEMQALILYMMMDDGMQDISYIKWMKTYVMGFYKAYFITTLDTEDAPYKSDLFLLFHQSMKDIEGNSILSFVPTLIKIYDQTFLGSIRDFIVSDPVDIENRNEYEVGDYIIELNHLISTDQKDAIEKLIVRAFTRRLDNALEDVLSVDDYQSIIQSQIISTMQLCPLMDFCNVIEIVKTGNNAIRLKLSLRVKKYSTGTIIMNITVNLKD